jgi:hypothetical protein
VVHAIRRRVRGGEPLDAWGRRASEDRGGTIRYVARCIEPAGRERSKKPHPPR